MSRFTSIKQGRGNVKSTTCHPDAWPLRTASERANEQVPPRKSLLIHAARASVSAAVCARGRAGRQSHIWNALDSTGNPSTSSARIRRSADRISRADNPTLAPSVGMCTPDQVKRPPSLLMPSGSVRSSGDTSPKPLGMGQLTLYVMLLEGCPFKKIEPWHAQRSCVSVA
jgi:hypothetical protein